MVVTSYLNKTVVSLDYMQIGNVIDEESHKMTIIDRSNGNRFTIPLCKVFSVDNTNPNNLIVDVEYHEAGRYKLNSLVLGHLCIF
jgi:hypothetical protein